MDNVQRDEFTFKANCVSPSKNDVFVLRLIDIVNFLGISREVQKKIIQADFDWDNYEHMEHLARYCMGVLEEMKND